MTAALDRFGGISLDELVAEAALLKRVDRKYVLPRSEVSVVLDALAPQTRALEIDGERAFAYRSLYFDTPDLLSFHMAAHPRRRRFKVRTREYVDTGGAYLEIKTRGARGATVKDRGEYDGGDRLNSEARADIGDAFHTIGVAAERVIELQPTLVTRYDRTTLLTADGASRATLDTELRWDGADGTSLDLPDLAIVETKSAGASSDVDRALWRAGHRPVSVSKYATGLAALRPDLPRNRWARVLRQSFRPATVASHVTSGGLLAVGN